MRIKFFSILTLLLLFSNYLMAVDEPEFNSTFKDDNLEIREYAPKILAQVSVLGDFNEATSKGFKLLADFIFGNNISIDGSSKIDMTAPVVVEPVSEIINMTAPVITEGINNEWVVSFVMPKEYSLSTLPKPNNKNITITRLPAEKYAVIVFSGLVRKSNYDEQVKLLKKFILKKNLKTIGLIQIARYNPPWTLPFFRRNELMIRIN
jgi:effector-binding domain-containing protein